MLKNVKWTDVKILLMNPRYFLPFIHILLTFIFERKIFLFSSDNMEFLLSTERTDYISDVAELVITYALSKIFAVILIVMLWKLIFAIVDKQIKKNMIKMFGTILVIGLIAGLYSYPSTFGLEIDNFSNYLMAIRFVPTYWQSIYTGAFYAGCMMVLPHPIALFIIQWTLFVATVAYIYNGVSNLTNGSRVKYFSLLLFVLPETYYIVFNAYRNNYYTILCLFYFSYIFFSSRKKDASFSIKQIVGISALSAFIMVWRSEGILIGMGGMLYVLMFVIKPSPKKLIVTTVTIACSFLVLSSIQGIGSKKYYGQDYMILNTTNVLYSIFNDPNANLSYDRAEEDLANIEAVMPVQVLKESAMRGFRNYNWTAGRRDFNQTLASDIQAKNYMRSYYRIILNNPKDYLDVQINNFYNALQVGVGHKTFGYTGESHTELQPFVYDRWRFGAEEVRDTLYSREWEENEGRQFIYLVISEIMNVWREMITSVGINSMLHSIAILGIFLMAIYEMLKLIEGSKDKAIDFLLLSLILVGEAIAILLFMPEGRPPYLYPMLYSSYIVIFYYFISRKHAESII